jgi:hypothetical protein
MPREITKKMLLAYLDRARPPPRGPGENERERERDLPVGNMRGYKQFGTPTR